MKIDRDVALLEKSLEKGNLIKARTVIESNMKAFTSPAIRNQLSMMALTLVNIVVDMNEGVYKDIYSRETQLIIAHINKLARDCKFNDLKRYAFLQSELLSNLKVYDMLSADAKIFIAPPKQEKSDAVTVSLHN